MRLLRILVGAIVVLGLLLAVSPLAIKWYLTHRLEAGGFKVQIKRLGIDYLFGEIELHGVDIFKPDLGRLRLFEAELDLGLWASRKGDLILQSVKLNNAYVDLPVLAEIATAIGLPMPAASHNTAGRPYRVRRVEMENVEVCRASQHQCLRLESAIVAGAQWQRSEDGWQFVHRRPLRVRKAFLRDQAGGSAIFYLGELQVDSGSWAKSGLDLLQVEFDNLHLVENSTEDTDLDAPYQTQMSGLSISHAQLALGDTPALRLGDVKAISLRQALHRGADLKLRGPSNFAAWLPQLSQTLARPSQIALSLSSLEVQGGVVAWTDKSVRPVAQQNVSQISLRVGSFDSTLPALPTPVKLTAKLGQTGSVTMDGEVYPSSDKPHFSVDAVVEGLELSKITAYTKNLLRHRVDAGEVDLSVQMQASDGRVQAETRWRLTGIEFEKSVEASGRGSLQQLFNQAADRKGSVVIIFPVSGELGEEITASHIFGTLMPRALEQMAQVQDTGVIAPRK